jgi:thioesterase domain-containing protein
MQPRTPHDSGSPADLAAARGEPAGSEGSRESAGADAAPTLFCWAPSGKSIAVLVPLAGRLGGVASVHGCEHSGIDGKRLPDKSVAAAALRHLGHIRRHTSGPFLLAGASFGGLVAYEVAQQLVRAGEKVAMVALLDSRAPAFPAAGANLGVREKLAVAATRLLPVGSFDPGGKELLLGLRRGAGRLGARARAEWCALRGVPLPHRFRHDNLLDFADRARRRYRPLPPAFDVVLFATETRLPSMFRTDDSLGWRDIAGSRLEVRRITGEHGRCLDGAGLDGLAEGLRAAIARRPVS